MVEHNKKSIKKLYVIYLIGTIILSAAEICRIFAGYINVYSGKKVISDILVFFQRQDMMVLPIPVIFGLYIIIRHSFNVNYIIRFKSRRVLWHHQSLDLILWCLFLSLLNMAMITLLGKFAAFHMCDWDLQTGSIFLQFGQVKDNVNFIIVFVVYALMFFFKLLIIGWGILLAYWLSNHFIYGVITALVIIALFSWTNGWYMFFGYDEWLKYPNSLSIFIIPIGIIVLLFMIGRFIAGKKNFYGRAGK